MKTNADIFRLIFTHIAGEEQVEEMLMDMRKRFFGNAAKCKLDEVVSEQYYQEAITRIPIEMPGFKEFLENFVPTSQYRFD